MNNNFREHPDESTVLRFLDGELTEREAAELRSHLDGCWQCRRNLGEWQGTIDAFLRLRETVQFPADPPPLPRFAAQGYFLHVGRRDRRKNLPRLIAAHRLSGTRRPLLLVGPDGDETAILGIDGAQVVALGWLPAAALAGLIAHARGLLLPSLAEGFGLPIIEAMRLGTAVLTSDRGATAEIAGDAAILVDPLAVEAIAAGIARLDTGTETAGMVVAGRQRALNFSLERYANRLASLYRSLADNRQARA